MKVGGFEIGVLVGVFLVVVVGWCPVVVDGFIFGVVVLIVYVIVLEVWHRFLVSY